MIEVDFKDRVPTNPGRVVLEPVAGAVNTYDMVRADDPTEEGTPLDKATFNSFLHSRLTGRYYVPTVTRVELTNVTADASPMPASGWLNATTTYAALNGYELFSSSASVQSDLITTITDGDVATFWRGISGDDNYIGFKLPTALYVSKIKAMASFTDGDIGQVIVQASNNGTTWQDVSESFYLGETRGMVEVTLTTIDQFTHYRLKFLDITLDIGIEVYSFEISSFTVTTAKNEILMVEGVPINFDVAQRILIQTPSDFSTIGVTSNTFNGNSLSTILQPGTRYELVWTGVEFTAKVV